MNELAMQVADTTSMSTPAQIRAKKNEIESLKATIERRDVWLNSPGSRDSYNYSEVVSDRRRLEEKLEVAKSELSELEAQQ